MVQLHPTYLRQKPIDKSMLEECSAICSGYLLELNKLKIPKSQLICNITLEEDINNLLNYFRKSKLPQTNSLENDKMT